VARLRPLFAALGFGFPSLVPVALAAQATRAGATPAPAVAEIPSASPTVARTPTMVLLVRHAEKAAEPSDDPPLSAAGSARARALAAALADAGVGAVIVSPRIRTRDTAQPLLDTLHLAPEVVPLGGPAAAHAEGVAAAVRRHAGQVVLVVGHSNTVPAIVAALGGPRLPDICDAAYANLYVLLLDAPGADGKARLVRTHYGAADDPAATASCGGMQSR
jgi:broad specificity phosphatase PhoE